jgi:hypothetical protein
MLDEGVYTSVSEIGDAEKISKSYVSRILRLAMLPCKSATAAAPADCTMHVIWGRKCEEKRM